jgi:UDPglucose 6-dehydrogenase/GDP-mannose 6-dehydrogenase
MNPEFLREGSALNDFRNPDRIVLGADDKRSAHSLRQLYASWDVDLVEVNTRTAEMIKYANNCLLATQISASNELANLAATLGDIDAFEVMRGIHLDARWNPVQNGQRVNPRILDYLLPGCGFGGSCFPKDLSAIATLGTQLDLPMQLLSAVLDVNRAQPHQVSVILEKLMGSLEGKKVAVLGLAFKPKTDDVRESPALDIICDLLSKGAKVTGADPIAHLNAKQVMIELDDVTVFMDWTDAVDGADATVIVTYWDEYINLPLDRLKALMAGDVLMDSRGVLPPWQYDKARDLDLRVCKIGFTWKNDG